MEKVLGAVHGFSKPLNLGVGSPKKRDLRPVTNFGTRVGEASEKAAERKNVVQSGRSGQPDWGLSEDKESGRFQQSPEAQAAPGRRGWAWRGRGATSCDQSGSSCGSRLPTLDVSQACQV